jgi:hypothetical protein
MATLKAQNFDLEFSYYDLNGCNEIEYSLDIKLNGKPFFNPDILSQTASSVKNGKFIVSDCFEFGDYLHTFFINILKTKKGKIYGTVEPPEWEFKAITWEDRRVEKEKSWEGRTVKTKNEQGKIIDVSYTETMKMFIPLWENDIEFKIDFPYEVFDTQEYTTFKLSLATNFSDLTKFLEDFGKEMNKFYDFFGDRIQYLGNGKYEVQDNFKYKDCSMDKDMYMIKRCAEWNNQSVNSDDEIVLKLLLNDIRWRNRIVGTVRHILDSSITEDLAKKIFTLAEKKLKEECDEEIVKRLEIVKMAIAISFPKTLTNSQLKDALNKSKKENIPEEIYEKNKVFYPKYLKN